MMKPTIEPNCRVVLDYTLRDSADEVIDASEGVDGEPIVYVHGYGMIVPGLERALVGLAAGDTKDVVLLPEEAFGERDEELVIEVDRAEMPRPREIEVGDELVAESSEGDEAVMRVVSVSEDAVVLDGNHPLAGETLRYSVIIREVRRATDEELAVAASGFEEAREENEPGEFDDEGIALVQLGRSSAPGKGLPN